MRAFCKRLCEETDELFRIDIFGKCVCARLDEAEHLLGCQDSKEVRERRPCDRRKEKVSARLNATKSYTEDEGQ